MTNWKEVGCGVLMWAPKADMEVNATSGAFSRLGVEAHDFEALEGGKHDAMETIFQDILATSTKAKTTSHIEILATPHRSSSTSQSSSQPTPVALSQLLSLPPPPTSSPTGSFSSISTVDFERASDHGYESDRTNFLETAYTPCPARQPGRPRHQTGFTSHFFSRAKASNRSSSVRRKLDFGKRTSIKPSKPKDTLSKMGLALEHAPRHSWSSSARQLLLVFHRWYNTEDRSTLNIIFNHIMGWNMKDSTIVAQFWDMKGAGPKACWEWDLVFDSVPFDDPIGQFVGYRQTIESTARDLGVDLVTRQNEYNFQPGSAAKSKSPQTRRKYRSRVRALKLAKKAQSQCVPLVENLTAPIPPVGNITLSPDASFDDSEILIDSEDSIEATPCKLVPVSFGEKAIPRVGYRVWDSNSKTIFNEQDGFVASGHQLWRGRPFLPPFSPEDQGQKALDFLLNCHLSIEGGASAFVSVSESLIQAFVKASNGMTRPFLSIIMLDHPLLAEPNKMLHAEHVLRRLKKQGEAWWARYKGKAEYIVWANIPRETILHTLPLADFLRLYDTDKDVANLLNLTEFRPKTSTMAVATAMKQKNIKMNTTVAAAMAHITKLLLGSGEVKPGYISEVTARLVDGWNITCDASCDIKSANAFALEYNSEVYTIQTVASSFLDGMKQGSDAIRFYTRRSRPMKGKVRRT